MSEPEKFITTKQLTIEGKVIPKGAIVGPEVDPDRVRNGLKNGAIIPQPPDEAQLPAAPAEVAVGTPTGETPAATKTKAKSRIG